MIAFLTRSKYLHLDTAVPYRFDNCPPRAAIRQKIGRADVDLVFSRRNQGLEQDARAGGASSRCAVYDETDGSPGALRELEILGAAQDLPRDAQPVLRKHRL